MATKAKVVESSFRLGSGRYIQEDGAILRLGEEIERLGCHKPFIIGGKTALSLTENDLNKTLNDHGMIAQFYLYTEFCNPDACEEIVSSFQFLDRDVVVGVGGGNVMDAAKLCAAMKGLPVINIPTSSATCAAYTPLSVMYNDRGQTIGTRHHLTEVNAILADMNVLCRQPVRLLVAGVYDSLAKLIELHQRMAGKSNEEIDIGLLSSYDLSRFLYDQLLLNLPEATNDVAQGKNTKAVYDTVYLTIALTGVISGLARGSNQTAIAHKVYETTRTLFPEIAHDALHGELVAIGLLTQLAYNGEEEKAASFREQMKANGMPTSLADVGIEPSDKTIEAYYEKIINSSAMNGTNDEEKANLRRTLEWIR